MAWYSLVNWYSVITTSLLAAVFILVYKNYPHLKCSLLWAWCYGLICISTLLALARGGSLFQANYVLIWLLNISLFLAFLLDYWGALKWQGKQVNYRLDIGAAAVFILIFTYYLIIDESLITRIVLFRIYFLVLATATGFTIMYHVKELNIGHKTAIFFLLMLAACQIFSLYSLIINDLSSLQTDSSLQAFFNLKATKIVYVTYPVVYLGIGLCYLLGMTLTLLRKEQELADIDDLTGCLNRRAFFRLFEAEFNRNNRNHTQIALVMLDIDHFKKINDTYGHCVGDEVLRGISKLMKKSLRSFDFVGRIGGEEFLIVLPNCSLQAGREAVERIRESINGVVFNSLSGDEFSITCSFGVVGINENLNPLTNYYEQVDEALYDAKSSGRDCVVVRE